VKATITVGRVFACRKNEYTNWPRAGAGKQGTDRSLGKDRIAVKSHSSTLEESDLERIQSELLSPEPREVVEQRIKSTVIRRRAVRLPPKRRNPKRLPSDPGRAVAAAAPPWSRPRKRCPPSPFPKKFRANLDLPGQARRRGGAQTVILAEAIPRPAKPASPATKVEAVRSEAPAAEPKAEPTKKPAAEAGPKAPVAEKKPLPVRPPEHRKASLPRARVNEGRMSRPSGTTHAAVPQEGSARQTGSENRQGWRTAPPGG